MTMAAMVAVIYRLSGLIGCLLGEQIVVLGISGTGLVRMVEFQVLRPELMKLVNVRHGSHRLQGNQ